MGLEARGVAPAERHDRALRMIDLIGLDGFEHWSKPAPGKPAPRIWIAGQDLTYHEDPAFWARVILEQTG
jgi:hypothetical protein